jgi:hypothetical protein
MNNVFSFLLSFMIDDDISFEKTGKKRILFYFSFLSSFFPFFELIFNVKIKRNNSIPDN